MAKRLSSKEIDGQKEALAIIDAVKTILSEMGASGSLWEDFEVSNINAQLSLNPLALLVNIITKFVTYEELVEWLADKLVYGIPAIELAVKGILLSRLKATVDCTNDPRIPNRFRDYGIDFNIGAIDYTDLLSCSPLSQDGSTRYFGTQMKYVVGDGEDSGEFIRRGDAVKYCEENGLDVSLITSQSDISSVYELARADDFNAFLWFVTHKCKFKSDTVSDIAAFKGSIGSNTKGGFIKPLYGYKTFNIDETKDYESGSLINGGNIQSLCIKCDESVDDNNSDGIQELVRPRNCEYTFVPMSEDNVSANWYVNRSQYFDFMTVPFTKGKRNKPRDYDKEFAICNLRYSKLDNSKNIILSGKNKLNVRILRKPLFNLDILKYLLFDSNGKQSSKGKYTIECGEDDYKTTGQTNSNVKGYYELQYGDKGRICCVCFKHGKYGLFGDENGNKPIEENPSKDNILSKVLHECYPGITVYEFNYDMVMGMRLFDAKVIAAELLNMALNIDLNLSLTRTQTPYKARISSIVKKLIEENTSEVADCFFSFSNDEYNSQLENSELKRYNLTSFNDGEGKSPSVDIESILNNLNAYNDNATKEENKETLKRTFNQATASISEEVLLEDRYNFRLNIIIYMLMCLINAIVETLITPKLVLLFEINRRMMGDDASILSFDDFLKSILGLLTVIIKEIRDMILQQLLDWVLSIIGELFKTIASLVVIEQVKYFKEIILWIIKNCFGGGSDENYGSSLDNVDYADIDGAVPQTSEC